MKIQVSKSELLNKLKMAAKVTAASKTMPILADFKLTVTDNTFLVTGSDMEGSIICHVDTISISGIEPDVQKSLMVDKTLLNALAELADQPVEITISNDYSISVKYSGGNFELQGSDTEDYPFMVTQGERKQISIPKQTLVEGIKTCAGFAGKNEIRPVMSGVYINATDTLDFVATDAHSLGLRKYDMQLDQLSVIVPTKCAKVITDILAKDKSEDEVLINVYDRNLQIDFGRYILTYRLIEGRYPNYPAVIPTGHTTKMVVSVADLISSIRRVSVFANSDSKLLKLDVSESGNIGIRVQDIDYKKSANEQMTAQVKGEDLSIGMNSAKLIEVLSTIDTDNCEILFSGPSRAVIVHPEGDSSVTLLLMPMLLN